MTRVGSPFSYARFRDAEFLCASCIEFGAKEYGATFAEDAQPCPRVCDACVQSRATVGVVVILPPFEETPYAARWRAR